VTGEDFRAAIVAAIGNSLEFIDAEHLLRLRGNVGKLCPIRASVRHLMGDDQVMVGIDCDLHIIADYTLTRPQLGGHFLFSGTGVARSISALSSG
jgi:hypothetical protein